MRRLLGASTLSLMIALSSPVAADNAWFRWGVGPMNHTMAEPEGPPDHGGNSNIEIAVDESTKTRAYGSLALPVLVNGIDNTYAVRVIGLPDGAEWVQDTASYGLGTISWQTASEGAYDLTVEVRDASDELVAQKSIDLVIHPDLTASVPQTVYEVDVDGALSITPSVTGLITPGAVQWGSTLSALPAWLDLDGDTGVITVDTTSAHPAEDLVLTAVDQVDRTGSSTSVFSVAVIDACDPWTLHPATAQYEWYGITYGNDRFVAVSRNGGIMTSPDGIAWSEGYGSKNSAWNAVAYGNGQYVAVSAYGDVMSSPDGIAWTTRPGTGTNYWSSVTYGNGMFVAVSSAWDKGPRIITSPDGISWTGHQVSLGSGMYSVTYGNGRFVAVGDSGLVFASVDGITWTYAGMPAGFTSVTYGNGLFVAVASAGTNQVATSVDGVAWTSRSAPLGRWYAVAYGDGQFVATGAGSASLNTIMTSPDGIAWTVVSSLHVGGNWQSVVYGNGRFVTLSSTSSADQVMTSVCN